MAGANILPYQDASTARNDRERLILEHLPQVQWIARRIHERLPDSIPLEDLVSTGIIGLIAAVDNYDPSYNTKLSTYAEHKIRGAILDSIRGLDGIPSHKRKKLKQIEAAIERAQQRLHHSPTEEDIAVELNISLAEYHEWLGEVRGVTIGRLDPASEDDNGGSLLNYVADPSDNTPTRVLERAELENLIAEAIAQLPEVEQIVLNLYYKEEQNLREIAPVLNLHVTRISQLKAQAILRLRTYIGKRWPSERGIY